ncbi:hypothetical protein MXAN_4507 [Myxococcus xanthus DK 1622]|uniref:Uncharacterized protein n=1 Tax=Myxococcus xanthus (strain DK1622) TaxID=246197 RepID=Q1D3U7_MYXXD|nr:MULTISPECIES: hypothetical protein [Myxococcus]ABF89023.1 hypothetical protein MXAN_4507 [Myxococcus xanthus DK 1622]NOJ53164.1 hypothetical protein [Myxococcus xanthus]QPM77082.1 hypothetical protein I5Q59_22305 [Myxococcus xanthus]QVW66150.1 hypothetical protein JTM82_27660 [Myxococcus xanthus DZ2]QZZ52189.1 hypothetical protein MyxoNM_23545 [Myxococcus xanthus]
MFNPTSGPAREKLTWETAQALETARAMVHDDRRVRSFFFDGRFLTAKDLTREQNYFLTRQADLSRANGTGVMHGLTVTPSQDRTTLTVRLGHGLTPGGELVVVPRDLTGIRLDDIPEIQRLDAAFGLAPVPRELARSRSGLYVLVLRPVEYTANPVASYPTSMGAARTTQDGDIIEAVALTLIPYPDPVSGGTFETRRSRAAHEVFAGAGMRNLPVDALPLAMLALDRGTLRWLDTFLVRREVGAEQRSVVGFGVAPRELREAHALQYQQHLKEVLQARRAAGQSERFLASEHFFTLPAAGTLPAAAIEAGSLTEFYFPPEVDVELTVVAEDELGAILDESLQLPPIDLTQTGEALESVSVLVMVPLARHGMAQRLEGLREVLRAAPLKLRAAAVGQVARRLPAHALLDLTRRWQVQPVPEAPVTDLVDAAWSELLSGSRTLWYACRRSLPYHHSAAGQPLPEPEDHDGEQNFEELVKKLRQAELYDEFSALPQRGTAMAIGQLVPLLNTLAHGTTRWQFAGMASATLRLERLQHKEYMAALNRFPATVKQGLARLEADPRLLSVPMTTLAASYRMPDIGAYVMTLTAAAYATFVTELKKLLDEGVSLDEAFLALRS